MALITCNGITFRCAPEYQFDEHPNTAAGNPAFELPPGMEKFFATWDGEPVNGHVLLDRKGELLVEKLRATDSDEDLSVNDLESSAVVIRSDDSVVQQEADDLDGKGTQDGLVVEKVNHTSSAELSGAAAESEPQKKKQSRGRKRDLATVAKLQAVVTVNPYKYGTKKEQSAAWEAAAKMAFYALTEGNAKKREEGIADLIKDVHNLKQLINRQIDNDTKEFGAKGTGDEEEQQDEHDVLVSQIKEYAKQGPTVTPKASSLKCDTARYKAGELQRLQALTRTTLGMSTGNRKSRIMEEFEAGKDVRAPGAAENPEILFIGGVAGRGKLLEKPETEDQDMHRNLAVSVGKEQAADDAEKSVVDFEGDDYPGKPGTRNSKDAEQRIQAKSSRGPYRIKNRSSNENESPDGRTRKAARSQLADHMGLLASSLESTARDEKAELELRKEEQELRRQEREEARLRDQRDREERERRHQDEMEIRRGELALNAKSQENTHTLVLTMLTALTKKLGE